MSLGYYQVFVSTVMQLVTVSSHTIPTVSMARGPAWQGQALVTVSLEESYTVSELSFLLPAKEETVFSFIYTLLDRVVCPQENGS